MHNNDDIALPLVPAELVATYGDSPGYKQIYAAILDGATFGRRNGSRWYVARSDLPAVARHFGLAVAA